MVAMLAPHGFPPSEVWGWTLADYRIVVDTLNELNGGDEDGSNLPAPSIEEHRAAKAAFMERERKRLENAQ